MPLRCCPRSHGIIRLLFYLIRLSIMKVIIANDEGVTTLLFEVDGGSTDLVLLEDFFCEVQSFFGVVRSDQNTRAQTLKALNLMKRIVDEKLAALPPEDQLALQGFSRGRNTTTWKCTAAGKTTTVRNVRDHT